MNKDLEEARKAQLDAWRMGCALESDYTLLEATQRAIEAQTEDCPDCKGYGKVYYDEFHQSDSICPNCNGRGRVRKDGV